LMRISILSPVGRMNVSDSSDLRVRTSMGISLG